MVAKSFLGGQLYLIGGRNNSSSGNMDSDSVERYDPFYDEWSNVASLTVPRNRLGVGVVDGVVFAVGGSDGIYLDFHYILFCFSFFVLRVSLSIQEAGAIIIFFLMQTFHSQTNHILH